MQTEKIYGLHAVSSLLAKHPERVQKLHVQKGRDDKRMQAIISVAKDHGVIVEYVGKDKLDTLSEEHNHQGIIASCSPSESYQENDIPSFLEGLTKPAFLLILDSVQDPHNLGACIRTADAAGVDMIIMPKDKAVGITPVVRKVACGAAETLPVVSVTNLARTMRLLQDAGIWLYGAAGEAEADIYNTDLTGPIAVVMGAEGKGLRQLTRQHCDGLIRIPMAGSVSSLNVSVATGVCLYEVVRQRQAR